MGGTVVGHCRSMDSVFAGLRRPEDRWNPSSQPDQPVFQVHSPKPRRLTRLPCGWQQGMTASEPTTKINVAVREAFPSSVPKRSMHSDRAGFSNSTGRCSGTLGRENSSFLRGNLTVGRNHVTHSSASRDSNKETAGSCARRQHLSSHCAGD